MRSSSQHVFAQVPKASIPRSSLPRNQTWKTAFYAGFLVPIFVDEVLPGDTFNVKITQFARLSNALSLPLMDNIYMDTHFFYVPNRLLWEHWDRMLGEQPNPGDSTDFITPIIKWKDSQNNDAPVTVESLSDYFSLPLGWKGDTCAFWHRAYNLVWNEWYRDENLQNRVTQNVGDGPDPITDYQLLRRGKRHDYFTSCLPFVQKGPASTVSVNGIVPVTGYDGENWKAFALTGVDGISATESQKGYLFRNVSSNYVSNFGYNSSLSVPNVGASISQPTSGANNVPVNQALTVPYDSLYADLTDGVSFTINQLREAFAIQKLYERDARGGTRVKELLLSHFGVNTGDARLQRPEYLGGGSFPINIHSVAQTSATEGESLTPQGNLAAYGLGGGRCGFVKSFVEHGVIIGLASVRCDLTYQQGVHKMFSRRNRLDFYWPALHNLGEQAVLNKEIFADNSANDDLPFGYQERWAEYRYGQSRITGKLRSTATTSLDAWHLAQYFTTRPGLNSDFISEHPPLDRCLAISDEPQIIYDSVIQCNCVRPMGVYSVPGSIDHL